MAIYDLIWERGSAREIMKMSRMNLKHHPPKELHAAYIALASAHYSLVKRYKGLLLPLAAWHTWRATWNVNTALRITECSTQSFSAEQIDVVTKILSKAPIWLGGDRVCAVSLLHTALYQDTRSEMMPHTRALMLITLGEIKWQVGKLDAAREHFSEANNLIPVIEKENSSDRVKQLVRVMTSVGFFFYDHSESDVKAWAEKLVNHALVLARKSSKDQEMKILSEWKKRGR